MTKVYYQGKHWGASDLKDCDFKIWSRNYRTVALAITLGLKTNVNIHRIENSLHLYNYDGRRYMVLSAGEQRYLAYYDELPQDKVVINGNHYVIIELARGTK